ncbi:hypothetical protein R1flu_017870 [Riccia fluitans]|uniref:Uncharacterized protein n=1 Tax=Riccia fluitans TaxID=41844 RepID=A0ABD1ZE69_9MARC
MDTVYILMHHDENIFIVTWDLKNGILEKKHLPLDPKVHDLNLVIYDEVDASQKRHRRLEHSISEIRVYDFKPKGCHFAEVYRSARQDTRRYGTELVADSECIHFMTWTFDCDMSKPDYDDYDGKETSDVAILSFNVLTQTFFEGARSPPSVNGKESWITSTSCFHPGLNPFAVP